jgi:hypothetical protein
MSELAIDKKGWQCIDGKRAGRGEEQCEERIRNRLSTCPSRSNK